MYLIILLKRLKKIFWKFINICVRYRLRGGGALKIYFEPNMISCSFCKIFLMKAIKYTVDLIYEEYINLGTTRRTN